MGEEKREAFRTAAPGLCGCVGAAAFAAIAAFPLLFILAWGGSHCEPVPECRRAGERAFAVEMVVVVALALLFGAAIRALVRWNMLRRRDPAAAGRVPPWAVAVVAVLGLVALWIGSQIFLW